MVCGTFGINFRVNKVYEFIAALSRGNVSRIPLQNLTQLYFFFLFLTAPSNYVDCVRGSEPPLYYYITIVN